MKYDVEIGSGVMIYIPSFIMTCSAIQTLMGVGCTDIWAAKNKKEVYEITLLSVCIFIPVIILFSFSVRFCRMIGK
jgi:hypothetical protein